MAGRDDDEGGRRGDGRAEGRRGPIPRTVFSPNPGRRLDAEAGRSGPDRPERDDLRRPAAPEPQRARERGGERDRGGRDDVRDGARDGAPAGARGRDRDRTGDDGRGRRWDEDSAPHRGARAERGDGARRRADAARFDEARRRAAGNPLAAGAAPVFDLVIYLRGRRKPLDTARLRDQFEALLDRFREDADAARCAPATIADAHFALCATVDDQMMTARWADAVSPETRWDATTLVFRHHRDRQAGDAFYRLLDEAKRAGRSGADLVELMYLCLSLGFLGRLQRDRRESAAEVRRSAFDAIARARGPFPDELSARWRGVDTERRPFREIVPLPLAAAASVLAAAGLYWLFLGWTADAAADAAAAVEGQAPRAEVVIVRAEPPPPARPAPPPPPLAERLAGFLRPEIDRKLVEVVSGAGEVRVRLIGAGMFDSGEATILAASLPVLDRVAAALAAEPGRIVTEGHTDSAPVTKKRKFADNRALSLARAEAVAARIGAGLAGRRIETIGLAFTVPLEPADAAKEAKARNRRVEIVLREDGRGG